MPLFQKKLELFILYVLIVFLGATLSADVQIYLAPNGGFSPENNKRTITLKEGVVPATLTNALLEMIEKTENGGQINIAMYAFSYDKVQDALIAASRDRQIKVKVILDAVASWTVEIRDLFKKKIMAEEKAAKEEGREFLFQLKEIYPEVIKNRARTRVLDDGTVIYGTMHEKFGVFYKKGNPVPLHAFCGSANVSKGAGEVFAENRVFFHHEPEVARQLAEEFARLWNEYGTPFTDNCESERMVSFDSKLASIQIISNSKPVDEFKYQRIDNVLNEVLSTVEKNGSIDVAMFSFTHYRLASAILYLAYRNPGAKIRILMDQTQIESDENHQGVLGQFIEKSAQERKLTNLEVRYKWRSNAFGWDEESKSPQLIHWRNLLLHHKGVVVNGKLMAIGSYNWSASAEERNFENVMIFHGRTPQEKEVVKRFMAEYNFMWNRLKSKEPVTKKVVHPQVIAGEHGRMLKKKIKAAYGNALCRKIMATLDRTFKGLTVAEIVTQTELAEEVVVAQLKTLVEADLIFAEQAKEGAPKYALTD